MANLITAYRRLPNAVRRARLQAYLDKHPMAVCMASAEDLAFLRANEFKV